jgi:hypothetical protein
MSRARSPLALTAVIAAAATIGGCTSPEANRTRGGGAGADVGNRAGTVRMHEGSSQYWRTPERIDSEHPPLEPARHARELSRR